MTLTDADRGLLVRMGYTLEPGERSVWSTEKGHRVPVETALRRAREDDAAQPTSTVDHPSHYQYPSGVEVIEFCEWMAFNTGNAAKYIFRCDAKGARLEDLRKALWYIERELARRRANSDDDFFVCAPAEVHERVADYEAAERTWRGTAIAMLYDATTGITTLDPVEALLEAEKIVRDQIARAGG